MKSNQLRHLFRGIWAANLVVCLMVAGIFYWLNTPASAESGSEQDAASPTPAIIKDDATKQPRPSTTPIPPPTLRPTITAWPTPSPGPSLTPMAIPPANRSSIGETIEKRSQDVYRFGTGPVHKLIVAGIHGGSEWNTVELATQLIAYLNDHPDRVPLDTSLYIVPNINPDGSAREIGINGRANAHGVDLNRNWPYNWKAEWSRKGCWRWLLLSGGEFGGSEPEVQNLITFIDRIKPVALISYHSAGLGIFPGGRPDFPPSMRLAESFAEVSDYPYPPIDTGCEYTGNMTDWASSARNIPSVDIELSSHSGTDYEQNLLILQAFLNWKP